MSEIPESLNHLPLLTEQVTAIITKIRELGLHRAHYKGYADQGLIEALSRELGKDRFSIADFSNRWPCLWEPEDFPPETEDSLRPDWMKGITTYVEGGPSFIDLWIEEVTIPSRWYKTGAHPSDQIMLYAFLGKAQRVERLPGFEWSESRGVLFAKALEWNFNYQEINT